MNKTILATAVAVLAAPVTLCGLVIVTATGAISSAAVTAAAAACSYANPDADRVATAMLALTPRPVNETRWNRYRTLAGFTDG